MLKKYLYMAVTPDEYQLPLAVADSVQQLARMVGVTTNSICEKYSLADAKQYAEEMVEKG